MPTAQSTSSNSRAVKSSQQPSATKSTTQTNTTKAPLSTSEEHSAAAATGATGGVRTPPEQPEFVKQALIIIEKKTRNLEKKRLKLEEYRDLQRKGQTLNEDQLLAVSRFDEVQRSIELTKELEKQLVTLANDTMKQLKKQAKKEQLEREEQIKERLKECIKYIKAMDMLGDDEVRNVFLTESNGAIKLSDDELRFLDEFDTLLKRTELNASRLDASNAEAAEHLLALVDAKNKPIAGFSVTTMTYQEMRKLLDRIINASYWSQEETATATQEQQVVVESSSVPTGVNPDPTVAANELIDQQQQLQYQQTNEYHSNDYANSAYDAQQQTLQQQTQLEHAMYQQCQIHGGQNTSSDDYVMVNTNDLSGADAQLNRTDADTGTQQQQSKAFFTTLVPQQTNINELISGQNDNGLNFLQDSEIQHQQQQQQNEQQQQADFNQNDRNQQSNDGFRQQQRGGYRGDRNNADRPHYRDQRDQRDQRQPRYDNDRPRSNNDNNNAPRRTNNGERPQYRNGGGQNGGTSGGNGGGYRQQQYGQEHRSGNGAPRQSGGGNGNYRQGQPRNNNGPRPNYQQQQQQPQQQQTA